MESKIEIEAKTENLQQVLVFIQEHLKTASCSPKTIMQVNLASEEIFTNIASYSYGAEGGTVTVCVETSDDLSIIKITFVDKGVSYDPLAKEDPDVTLPLEKRGIGGLGIFLTKKIMDEVTYSYKDGCNILTLKKKL